MLDNLTVLLPSDLTVSRLHLNSADIAHFFSMNAGRGCKASYAIYSLRASARMSWHPSNHAVIRRQAIDLPLYVSTHHPAPGTTPPNHTCATAR